MVQELTSQPTIFGRLGKGLAQGLVETVPKEIERSRLASGLEALGKEKGLTPFQQFARLSSIPGVSPQMIESGSKLLRQEQQRQAYTRGGASREQENLSASPQLHDVRFANINPQANRQEQVSPQEYGQPQIQEKNPLRPEAQPVLPWTQERRDQEIGRVLEQDPGRTLAEAVNIAADNEKRDLARPAAERAADQALRDVEALVEDEFTKQLELKLQKQGEGVFKDVTGENLNNIKRSIERDLRTNPKATVKDVVNYWTNKALDLSKTKRQLATLSQQNIIDKIGKKEQTFNKLKSYQKIFDETGNKEEFWNKLQDDFDMSPQAAAYLAYPSSKNVNEYINNAKRSKPIPHEAQSDSRKKAIDLEKLITANDSLLAIVKRLKDQDPYFDETSFYNQLRDDQDQLGLTALQKRELGEAESATFPTWGDISILPVFRGQLK